MNGNVSPLCSLENERITDQVTNRYSFCIDKYVQLLVNQKSFVTHPVSNAYCLFRPSHSSHDEIKLESRRQASFEEPNKNAINQVR